MSRHTLVVCGGDPQHTLVVCGGYPHLAQHTLVVCGGDPVSAGGEVEVRRRGRDLRGGLG